MSAAGPSIKRVVSGTASSAKSMAGVAVLTGPVSLADSRTSPAQSMSEVAGQAWSSELSFCESPDLSVMPSISIENSEPLGRSIRKNATGTGSPLFSPPMEEITPFAHESGAFTIPVLSEETDTSLDPSTELVCDLTVDPDTIVVRRRAKVQTARSDQSSTYFGRFIDTDCESSSGLAIAPDDPDPSESSISAAVESKALTDATDEESVIKDSTATAAATVTTTDSSSSSSSSSSRTESSSSMSSESIREPIPDLDFIDEEAALLRLFNYRNIAWRYFLSYCMPLSEALLMEQLEEEAEELFDDSEDIYENGYDSDLSREECTKTPASASLSLSATASFKERTESAVDNMLQFLPKFAGERSRKRPGHIGATSSASSALATATGASSSSSTSLISTSDLDLALPMTELNGTPESKSPATLGVQRKHAATLSDLPRELVAFFKSSPTDKALDSPVSIHSTQSSGGVISSRFSRLVGTPTGLAIGSSSSSSSAYSSTMSGRKSLSSRPSWLSKLMGGGSGGGSGTPSSVESKSPGSTTTTTSMELVTKSAPLEQVDEADLLGPDIVVTPVGDSVDRLPPSRTKLRTSASAMAGSSSVMKQKNNQLDPYPAGVRRSVSTSSLIDSESDNDLKGGGSDGPSFAAKSVPLSTVASDTAKRTSDKQSEDFGTHSSSKKKRSSGKKKTKKKNEKEKQDFYKLPIIDIKELREMFEDGRRYYSTLSEVYVTKEQSKVRDDYLDSILSKHRSGDSYSDTGTQEMKKEELRSRSKTLVALSDRSERKPKVLFSRVDIVIDDWKKQRDEPIDEDQPARRLPTKPPPLPPPQDPIDQRVVLRHSIIARHSEDSSDRRGSEYYFANRRSFVPLRSRQAVVSPPFPPPRAPAPSVSDLTSPSSASSVVAPARPVRKDVVHETMARWMRKMAAVTSIAGGSSKNLNESLVSTDDHGSRRVLKSSVDDTGLELISGATIRGSGAKAMGLRSSEMGFQRSSGPFSPEIMNVQDLDEGGLSLAQRAELRQSGDSTSLSLLDFFSSEQRKSESIRKIGKRKEKEDSDADADGDGSTAMSADHTEMESGDLRIGKHAVLEAPSLRVRSVSDSDLPRVSERFLKRVTQAGTDPSGVLSPSAKEEPFDWWFLHHLHSAGSGTSTPLVVTDFEITPAAVGGGMGSDSGSSSADSSLSVYSDDLEDTMDADSENNLMMDEDEEEEVTPSIDRTVSHNDAYQSRSPLFKPLKSQASSKDLPPIDDAEKEPGTPLTPDSMTSMDTAPVPTASASSSGSGSGLSVGGGLSTALPKMHYSSLAKGMKKQSMKKKEECSESDETSSTIATGLVIGGMKSEVTVETDELTIAVSKPDDETKDGVSSDRKELEASGDHDRGRFDVPSTLISMSHLIPLPDFQRRRESAQIEEGSEQWKQIQKLRENMSENYGIQTLGEDDVVAAGGAASSEDDGVISDERKSDDQKSVSDELAPEELNRLTSDVIEELDMMSELEHSSSSSLSLSSLKEDGKEEDSFEDRLLDPLSVKKDSKKEEQKKGDKGDDDHQPLLEKRQSFIERPKKPWASPRVSKDDSPAALDEKANSELWFQIMKDVCRTLQYKQQFRERRTQVMVGNILYVWARRNPKHGYIQGMNEILAHICCALWYDLEERTSINEDDCKGDRDEWNLMRIAQELVDQRFFEHDCFVLFNALMSLVVQLFGAAIRPRIKTASTKTSSSSSSAWLHPSSASSSSSSSDSSSTDESHFNMGLFDCGVKAPLYLRLHFVQHKLLKHFDLVLYTHLCRIGLEPQLYMMRWLRLLFCREMYIDQTIILWDNLFVSSTKMSSMMDYFVLAMLTQIREQLLDFKDISAIQLLQKYPKDEIEIEELIETARKIANGLIHLDYDKDLRLSADLLQNPDEVSGLFKEASSMFVKKSTEKIELRGYPEKSKKLTELFQLVPTSSVSSSSAFRSDADFTDDESSELISRRLSIVQVVSTPTIPGVEVPGYRGLTERDKFRIKRIILNDYGLKVQSTKTSRDSNVIRMGYLVKRGDSSKGYFSRDSLKLRWFVATEARKLYYYRNYSDYAERNEEPMKPGVDLTGRAIRVVNHKLLCFEVSGTKKAKRPYLLIAPSFRDFVLWLHSLMVCADSRIEET